ncbi:PREDICTED: uncharacterized protein LOC107185998 isoform X2 [Dufourea novaeangliae]|uniref:uncharacterized protein LOC107185998 isoform X2 n=1 Tax=Dufourea novaeangliae TaxID=178035 RepID=UPI000767C926|nr:PREDICTED: uncharacterized protein LOC107185998 isoform X2 [Dufourea novaeangliae]
MGNYVNKFFLHDTETVNEETKIQSPSTDEETIEETTHTPVIQKRLPIDPRSVTSGIDRTPIEGTYAKRYLETDLDKIIPPLTPRKCVPKVENENLYLHVDSRNAETNRQLTPTIDKVIYKRVFTPIEKERYNVLGLDPRSPAADFDRTPILIPKSIALLKARVQESLHRRGSYNTDVLTPKFSYCETSSEFSIPEIQALPDLAMCKIRSLNLVTDEFDNKLNKSDSSCSSDSSMTDTNSEIGEDITFIVSFQFNSSRIGTNINDTIGEKQLESEDAGTTSDHDTYNNVHITKDVQHNGNHGSDSDAIKIWKFSLIQDKPKSELAESHDVQDIEDKMSQLPKEEVIIAFDDDSTAKDTLSLKLAKCDINKKKTDVTAKRRKVFKSETKTVLDEKKMFNSDNKYRNEPTKIRTPLGNCSNNAQMQKNLATNSPQQIFKSKGIKTKMLQENTPPHKKHIARSKEFF